MVARIAGKYTWPGLCSRAERIGGCTDWPTRAGNMTMSLADPFLESPVHAGIDCFAHQTALRSLALPKGGVPASIAVSAAGRLMQPRHIVCRLRTEHQSEYEGTETNIPGIRHWDN